MNKKIQDMYQGQNFIYESLSSSLNEEKASGEESRKRAAMDSVSTVSNILNTLFTIILNSKNEGIKTQRGFSEIKNKMSGISNFGAFRQYIVSLIQSLSSLDPAQKISFDENIQYILSLFRTIETQMSDEKMFLSAKENLISKMLNDFEADLKEREDQMKKTKPSLFDEIKKSGEVVTEKRRSGDEKDPAEAEFRSKAFNKSKESLDAASAFVGMIDRDKYTPALKDNADIKKFKDVADDLYTKAQDLQMIDRRGLKVITPRGEVKRNDYMRDQDNLINEIIRQKKEYSRTKDAVLKQGGFTPPPVVPPVCPPGKIYDKGKGICVAVQQEETQEEETKPVVTTKECTFPVKLNTKCNDVGELQRKVIELFPNSVKEYLNNKGGADKVYGKGTALVCNAIWAQMKGITGRSADSELTKEMFDSIMALTSADVELYAKTFDSADPYMELEEKIQEMEEVKGTSIIDFDDYLNLLEESNDPDLNSLDEQVFDRLKKGAEEKSKDSEKKEEKEKEKEEKEEEERKIKENCLKNSLDTGTIDACIKPKEEEDEEDKEEDEDKEEEEEVIEWQGFKPVNDGVYTIYYDESWGEWFGSVTKGALVAGLVTGAVILTAGAAGIAIPVGGTLLGASSMGASGIAGALGAAGGLATTAGGYTLAAGAIGGTTIAKWAGSDRKPVSVIAFNGYMEEDAVYAMARGLYNSLGGTVSSQDVLAIMSTLIMCRGTYMNNGSGKAVAVWPTLKNRFAQLAGESISSSVDEIVSGGIGGWFKDWYTDMDEIPSFPRFRTKDPLSGVPVEFENAVDGIKRGIRDLDSNASKMNENLGNITEADLEMLAEGMDELTLAVSEYSEEE
jgi:hypothetical protein